MNGQHLTEFLKALGQVREDLKCAFCSELCEKPITLSQCFHIMCTAHYQSLKACPKCDTAFDGKTFSDSGLEKSIEAAKKLQSIFRPFEEESTQAPAQELGTKTDRKKRAKKRTETDENVDTSNNKTASTEKPRNLSLKKKKADVETVATVQSVVTVKVNKNLEKKNLKGETALHVACRLGKIEKVKELLNQGANVNTKDNAGWTPLHEVVQNGKLELLRLLLEHKALINVPGQSNETPLHEAIRYSHEDIVEELIKHGADINSRNSKGETPLDLAKGHMKEVIEVACENIVQTQGFNVSMISNLQAELDSDDIKVYCTSKFKTVHAKLKLLTKHHSNLHIELKFNKNVTHLVVDTEDEICTPTAEILQAIVNGLWIVDSNWLIKSTVKLLENFEKFEVSSVGSPGHHGPRNSRFNKYRQLPGLFDGCHFYFHNFNGKYEISKSLVVTKPILSKLVTDGGGVILRRVPNPESIPESEQLIPYHAKENGKLSACSHYIIFKDLYEPMYNMSHLKALPIGWLIECLESYELCEPEFVFGP
ncbi:BRCA1-associated RING domain protein 1 [Eumeta japonica]|uniref:BRCA1-associated RING domain protein 1 n=1 Tax=Eumeta variegata TaxID=151549 RepID=A0A4C1VCC9_EUMVA|nr:BRCA1-associated RING domain protein 1 [Eumeta japonica]